MNKLVIALAMLTMTLLASVSYGQKNSNPTHTNSIDTVELPIDSSQTSQDSNYSVSSRNQKLQISRYKQWKKEKERRKKIREKYQREKKDN